jgi:haloalkane dehalogenase
MKPALSELPFAEKKYLDIEGHRMAYMDEGEGPAIVFQHGNPASSYLWRNVMRAVDGHGLGRLIAADLMGLGESDKLPESMGPDRYSFAQQYRYLDRLLEHLDLGDDVVLVLHDLGSMLGFHWANQHRDRIQGIAYMEAIVKPILPSDIPDYRREVVSKIFSPDREVRDVTLYLDDPVAWILATREFTVTEQAYHRQPLLVPGEPRRATRSFELPFDGQPAHMVDLVEDYGQWLSTSDIPKLLIKSEPGYVLTDRLYDFAHTWPNQTELTVKGEHFIQESTPDEVGAAIVDFIRGLRGNTSEKGAD